MSYTATNAAQPSQEFKRFQGAGSLFLDVEAIEASRRRYGDHPGAGPAVIPEYNYLYQNRPSTTPPSNGASGHEAQRSSQWQSADQVYPLIQAGRSHHTHQLPGPQTLFNQALAINPTGGTATIAYLKPPKVLPVARSQDCQPCLGDTEVYRSLLQMPLLRQFARRRMPVVRLPIPATLDGRSAATMAVPQVPNMGRHIPFVPIDRTEDYPGISMYELLLQETKIHGAYDCVRLLTNENVLKVVFWASGYEVALDLVYTTCAHGTLTRVGLAYHIAYNFQTHLTRDTCWQSTHSKETPSPTVKNARRLRLISVFTLPHDPSIWYVEAAVVIDKNPERD